MDGLKNLYEHKLDNTPILAGAVSGRIHDIPKVSELIDRIMTGAERCSKKSKLTVNKHFLFLSSEALLWQKKLKTG